MADAPSTERRFALFDSAIGRCAILWSDRGVTGVRFPARDDGAMRRHLAQRAPGAREAEPPDWIARVIGDIAALLTGGRVDLAAVPIDWDGVDALVRRVCEAARAIPPGRTSTYAELAQSVGGD